MKIPSRATLAAVLGCACFASSAKAAIIITNTKDVAPTGGAVGTAYTPTTVTASSTDLIQGMTATVTYVGPAGGSTTNSGSRGVAAWTDGSLTTFYGAGSDSDNHSAYGTVSATVGTTARQVYVTYDLGSFYNISAVNVFTGWGDSGRDDSSFIVLTSADGTNYTSAFTYSKPADDTSSGPKTPITNLHSVTDNASGNIAAGVRYVQIEFTDSDNGYAGVAEIDVLGTAVPETSSAALGLLGGLMLLRRKRN